MAGGSNKTSLAGFFFCALALLLATGCGGGGGGSATPGGDASLVSRLSPPSGGAVSASVATVSLRTSPGSTVRLGEQYFSEATGAFSLQVSLKLGENRFSLSIETPQGETLVQTYTLHRQQPLVFSARSLKSGRGEVFYHDPVQGSLALTPVSLSAIVESQPDLSDNGLWAVVVRRTGGADQLVLYGVQAALAGEDEGAVVWANSQGAALFNPRFVVNDRTVMFFAAPVGNQGSWRLLDLATGQTTALSATHPQAVSPVLDATGQWLFFLENLEGETVLWQQRRGGEGFEPQQVARLVGEGASVCATGDELAVLHVGVAAPTGGTPPQTTTYVTLVNPQNQRQTGVAALPSTDQFALRCHTAQRVVLAGRLPYANGYFQVTEVSDWNNLDQAPSYELFLTSLGVLFDQVEGLNL